MIALAGSIGQGAASVHEVGIDAITSIMDVPMPLADAVAHSQRLLIDATEQMMRMILVGVAVATSRFDEGD